MGLYGEAKTKKCNSLYEITTLIFVSLSVRIEVPLELSETISCFVNTFLMLLLLFII